MIRKKLDKILKKHREWLKDRNEGEKADLTGADLTGADLTGANLTGADLTGADLTGANLTGAKLTDADLRRAKLSNADLRRAKLRRADLSGAELDFSCLPLWCGSFDMKVDDRIWAQLYNHLKSLDHPWSKELKQMDEKVEGLHIDSEKGWKEEEE